jgi:hypothetical protein
MARLNRGFEYKKHLGSDVAGMTAIEYLAGHYPRLIGRLSALFAFSCSATAASDRPASDKKL